MAIQRGIKIISKNKKAWHDYHVEESIECGIVLVGTEVKSIRQGNVNLKDSYALVRDGEVFVIGMHISPYEKGNIFNKDPFRRRKLLLNKHEIRKLKILTEKDGLSLIPLSLYFKDSKVKLELAVAKGKKQYDKRASIAERDTKRDIDRAVRNSRYE